MPIWIFSIILCGKLLPWLLMYIFETLQNIDTHILKLCTWYYESALKTYIKILLLLTFLSRLFVCLMVFNATFNNISVISVEETGESEKTTDLSQVPDKLYHIMLYYSPDYNKYRYIW
jgi:hypothetical protein